MPSRVQEGSGPIDTGASTPEIAASVIGVVLRGVGPGLWFRGGEGHREGVAGRGNRKGKGQEA